MLNIKRPAVTKLLKANFHTPQGGMDFFNLVSSIGEMLYQLPSVGFEGDNGSELSVDDADYFSFLNLCKHLVCRELGIENLNRAESEVILKRISNAGCLLTGLRRIEKAGGMIPFVRGTMQHMERIERYAPTNYKANKYTAENAPKIDPRFDVWEASLSGLPQQVKARINALGILKPI